MKVNVRSSELWPEQDRHVETLVDGHERIWQALQANNADVPYIEVDLTPAEEALMLTSFDASGALADLDAVAFEDVLRDVDTGSAAIQEMLAQMAEEAGIGTDWALPDGEPMQEPELRSECFVEIECGADDLQLFQSTLTEWGRRPGVTVNIS